MSILAYKSWYLMISTGSIPAREIVGTSVCEACAGHCRGLIARLNESMSHRRQSCRMSELQGSVETIDKISPWFCGSWGLGGPGPLAG